MIDLKCKGCNKLLAKVESINGAIKCPRCKMIFEYKVYSNLFVTSQYDSSIKGLHYTKDSDTIVPESTET